MDLGFFFFFDWHLTGKTELKSNSARFGADDYGTKMAQEVASLKMLEDYVADQRDEIAVIILQSVSGLLPLPLTTSQR